MRLAPVLGLLLAASAWGGEPNPARPRPFTPKGQAASVAMLRAVHPDHDAKAGTVQGGGLEVIQSLAKRVPKRPGVWAVALLLSPPHAQTHAYGANGNYRVQLALVREQGKRMTRVAMSEPVTLIWAKDPHWEQALSWIDLADYRLTPGERALGLRVKAEYLYKLDSGKAEKLFLFREEAGLLRPILEAGALDCDCCPEEHPSDACDCFNTATCPAPLAEARFRMEPSAGGGPADIIQTVTSTRPWRSRVGRPADAGDTAEVRWQFEEGRYQRQGEDLLPR